MRKLYFTTAPTDRMALAVEMLYPTAWLDQVDADDAEGRTNRATRLEEYAHRYSFTCVVLSLSTTSCAERSLAFRPQRLTPSSS